MTTSPAAQAIFDGLTQLEGRFSEAFGAAGDEQTLRAEQARFLGKKGELTAVLAKLRDVPGPEKPSVGARVNAFKQAVEQAFEARLRGLARAAREAELSARPFDVTLPGRLALGVGSPHPLISARDDLLAIFQSLGFEDVSAPEVDLEANNFTRLAFPPDHPATDMQDSFWVEVDGVAASPGALLLRTHTSNAQVRTMMSRQPPMAAVHAGAVFRRDDDATHSPMFHQIEAFLVDERVSLAELRGVVTAFVERLYGKGTPVRFRPSYFPFVEPGVEVDCGCVFCKGAGCRTCKGTGFIEILGCGMIHPEVFRQTGVDPEKYSGFALGLGVDRVAMLRYGIPNIRVLFENDPRMLEQF